MIDFEKLKREQERLARNIVLKDSFEKLELIAGSDQAFFEDKIISAVVVCDLADLNVVERKFAIIKASMPYVPHFLSFRESPAIVEAYANLKHEPDVMLCDFNGILHPRRFGAACQVGLSLNIPTVGIAKNLIMGQVDGDKIYLDKELVARKIRIKEKSRPLFVSPGNLITLKTAVDVVKKCAKLPHKLPEPLHQAHRYAKKIRERHI